MPIFAYILCLIFQVSDLISIGCVLVGASPGGTTSNIFTYWSQGDVALSITMSLMSTLAAFFMMPFWIWLLVVVAFKSDAEIPFVNIVVSLLLIIIPTCGGLAIRYYNAEMKICDKFIWQWIELALWSDFFNLSLHSFNNHIRRHICCQSMVGLGNGLYPSAYRVSFRILGV